MQERLSKNEAYNNLFMNVVDMVAQQDMVYEELAEQINERKHKKGQAFALTESEQLRINLFCATLDLLIKYLPWRHVVALAESQAIDQELVSEWKASLDREFSEELALINYADAMAFYALWAKDVARSLAYIFASIGTSGVVVMGLACLGLLSPVALTAAALVATAIGALAFPIGALYLLAIGIVAFVEWCSKPSPVINLFVEGEPLTRDNAAQEVLVIYNKATADAKQTEEEIFTARRMKWSNLRCFSAPPDHERAELFIEHAGNNTNNF